MRGERGRIGRPAAPRNVPKRHATVGSVAGMATEHTAAGGGQIVFHPKRAPTGWRRVGGWASNLGLVVLVAISIAEGPNLLVWIALALLGVSLLLSAFGFVQQRRGRWRSAYDPRDEVVLPGELVRRVRELQIRDERSVAFRLLQSETDLGFDDTVRALRLVERSSTAA